MKRRLEVFLRVCATEEVAAGADFADGIERLAARAHVHAARQCLHHRELVDVHHELLIARDEPAFEPARGVRHEVDAGEQGRQQRVRALVRGLRIGRLGRAKRSAAAAGHAEASRQLRRGEDHLRRFGRAEGRRARAHRDGADERAHDHRSAGPHQLRERHAGQRFGQQFRHAAGRRDGTHRAGEHGRHDDRALVVRRERAQRAEHAAIERQRRVRVDVAEQDAVGVDEVLAEHDAGHAHGVGRVSRRFGRAFAALVAVAEECVLDVEVALAFGHVHRLDHAAAGEMDRGCDVRELDEVVQVRERAVAAAAVEVGHEWRAADRREHRGIAAEPHGACRVSCVQLELARRRPQQLAREAAWNPHALALHVGACFPPEAQ